MGEIIVEQVGVNPYGAGAASSIDLYSYNGVGGLTIGQLILAVTIRRAAQIEQLSVNYMNVMTLGTDTLNQLTDWGTQLVETLKTSDASAFDNNVWKATNGLRNLLLKLGCEEKDLPTTILKSGSKTPDYDKVMQAYEALETKMEDISGTMDDMAVKLQSSISRRDSTYNLSTNIVANLGTASIDSANALKGR